MPVPCLEERYPLPGLDGGTHISPGGTLGYLPPVSQIGYPPVRKDRHRLVQNDGGTPPFGNDEVPPPQSDGLGIPSPVSRIGVAP